MMETYLKEIYTDPQHPASFTSVDKLYKWVKQDGKYKVKKHDIKKWLESVESYTLHRGVRRKFPRNRVEVAGIDIQWDSDLIDFVKIAKHNDSFKYVLICIDIFSRYVWLEPLKSKKGLDVAKAFEKIFKSGRKPLRNRNDKGGDFKNRQVKSLFKKYNILQMTTQNTETKACYAERAIKTIKKRIYKYFTQKQTYKYIDKLQDFAYSYNNTYHRSINMKPSEVSKENEKQLWFYQYAEPLLKNEKVLNQHKAKFKPGDLVRLSHIKQIFDREYNIRWSGEIFRLTDVIWTNRIPMYKVKDYYNSDIQGYMYGEELQKVTMDEDHPYKIDKIIKTRTRKGIKQHYVSWLYWGPKFNSWVNASDIESI
jgi:DNA-directed RNA polymerase beta' subunit